MRLRWGSAWSPTLRPGDAYKDALAWTAWTDAKGGLHLAAAVADGVSSQPRAREAALAAVAGLTKVLRRGPPSGIQDGFRAAQAAVATTGSATTLTGVLVSSYPGWGEVSVALVHSGDSRAWRLRANAAELRTRDENLLGAAWWGDPANEGKPPPVDGRGSNILLSCLDHRGTAAAHFDLFSLRSGDALVLCTDGCNQAGLPKQVEEADPGLAASRLVAAARANRSVDDATAVWIDVGA